MSFMLQIQINEFNVTGPTRCLTLPLVAECLTCLNAFNLNAFNLKLLARHGRKSKSTSSPCPRPAPGGRGALMPGGGTQRGEGLKEEGGGGT